ncbi:MAG: complex I NDUFA9 subunit family protein [Rubellimicrobium sp.]|nr:complex I NDUFA9 subunit family protein [Rubellimicrobium sp.]
MAQLVTIFGGSGFVGRHVARRMALAGWRVRVVTRDPNLAGFVRPYGVVGQVAPVFGNIRDDDSVAAAIAGSDAVVNCVGTFDASGRNGFDAVQHEGAGRVARLAAAAGVARLVHVSAIGADTGGASAYARSKAAGEDAVSAHFPGAVILRPSVIFGTDDSFFNRFAGMPGPVLPIVGGASRFQPVWVDDVAQAAQVALTGDVTPGVYELGGPDVATLRELMEDMLLEIRRRRVIINLPFWLARPVAGVITFAHVMSIGIIPRLLTIDQVAQLRSDNVVSEGARGFADLGIEPAAMAAIVPEYLWRFRPSGQYLAIKESARDLRN